jgi:hypothetical protein
MFINFFFPWWFAYNIPDSGASEYSTDTSNSGVGKYYVVIKQNKFKYIFLFPTLASVNKNKNKIYFYAYTYFLFFM